MVVTNRFDLLTSVFSRLLTRRTLAGAFGLTMLASPALVAAKRKKGKQKKKVKRNAFGCVNVGGFCKNGGQCCSGICKKNRCQAHDEATCQAGDTDAVCGGESVNCSAPGNNDGRCNTTTGNAGYCVGDRKCFSCTKDADCQGVNACGPDAACIVCATCIDTGGTACAGLVPGSC